MKTTTTIPRAVILSSENAAALAQYAKLTGWNITELANHILTEKIRWLTDENSSSAQEFLAEIYYSDRQSAQRALEHVMDLVRKGHNNRSPKSHQWAIRQHQDGRFNLSPTQ